MNQVRMTNTDSYVHCFQPNHSSKEAYLFLPSFPGTQGKNEDIAEAVSHKTCCHSYVIHYAGLGLATSKTFDFIKSVGESIQLAHLLLEKYEKLHLVGHSWGGLISLNLFSTTLTSEQRGQLILSAPFTEFPHDGSVESWLIPMATKKDFILFSDEDPEKVRDNFFSVEKIYHPRKGLSNLKPRKNQVALIEAINDPDVPNQSTDSLYQLLNHQGNALRVRLHDNHCFTNDRDAIIGSVLTVIDIYNISNLNANQSC